MTTSSSIPALINAIDEHPLRWEAITLESALSLPTLSKDEDEIRVEFFFYPVGGPIDHRQVWAPYYRVSSLATAPYDIQYRPILPSELNGIDSEAPLGSADLNINSRQDYNDQLDTLYNLTEQLVKIYPKPAEDLSEIEKGVMLDFLEFFNKLANPSLLDVYSTLNPSFFYWINLAR
jgi:hypothetical protein